MFMIIEAPDDQEGYLDIYISPSLYQNIPSCGRTAKNSMAVIITREPKVER